LYRGREATALASRCAAVAPTAAIAPTCAESHFLRRRRAHPLAGGESDDSCPHHRGHQTLPRGLAQLLAALDGFTVVGAEPDGREVAAGLDRMAPDVALVEMGIPDLDRIARTLAQRSPRIPLVAVGIADCDTDVLDCATDPSCVM